MRKRKRHTTYLDRVARQQEVRFDGRLPKDWLQAALSRFRNQRISFQIEGNKGQMLPVSAIYMGVRKLSSRRAADALFAVSVRDMVINGARLHGRGRRQRRMVVDVPLDMILGKPVGDPFWRAMARQRMAAAVTIPVQSEGR